MSSHSEPNSNSNTISPSLPSRMESNSDHVIDLTGVNGQSHHSPIVLTFADLCYSVKTSNKSLLFSRSKSIDGNVSDELTTKKSSRTKTLLNSVSGEAREGEITAVLGASGSGKSTLIDALAGRVSRDSLTGTVKLNGEVIDDGRLLKFISAYVMQDDLLFPMLTVEETFTFSAEFRLPMSMSKSKKKGRVQALIDQLGLRNAAKTIIGDEGHRGVSGGERRRVSIGMNIIHDPIILFLDEPMSGLDSTSAFMVVKVLQTIARSGSIVMMSVHQPSSRILNLLDRLIFLSRGNTVFNGRPDDLRRYFLEFGRPIPDNENRTEFALDVIRELESSTPSAVHLLVDHNKSWQSNNKVSDAGDCRSLTLNDAVKATISRGNLVSGSSIETTTTAAASDIDVKFNSLSNPFWYELGVLTRRAFKNTQRTPALFATRLIVVIITGIFLATVYWKLDTSPKGVQERLGFFAFAMSTTFYTCADTLPVFLQERYIFMRETAYNAYRRSSYVISNSIVAIPFLTVLSAAFAATTFFAVGLYGGAEGFGFYFLIVLASFWAGSSFVTFISGVISNVMMGYTVVVAVLAYYLLLSGFFISKERIPSYWIWFHYLSLVKYPYEAVLHSEFDDWSRCFARGIQIFDNSPVAGAPETVKIGLLGNISSVLGVRNVTVNTCITTGAEILQQQGIGDLSKWNCLWITLGWGLFFRVLFYFALLLGSKNQRR